MKGDDDWQIEDPDPGYGEELNPNNKNDDDATSPSQSPVQKKQSLIEEKSQIKEK